MYFKLVNRVLLGLLMLVPGLMKLLYIGPSQVAGMLSGMGFPAPTFFAWILIFAEIGSGLAILARWKLHYAVWPPVVILLVAGFVTASSNISSLLLHLVAASNYLLLGGCWCCGTMGCTECESMHGSKNSVVKSHKKR
jgi:uncharacterized membrane protein YphA (DoxX/SURF4 family)